MRGMMRYVIPVAGLSAVTLAFLLVPRRFKKLRGRLRYAVAGIAALPLIGSGILHLAYPSAYVPLLAPWVPDRRLIVMLTGLPELAGAAGLFVPRVQQAAAFWLAVMMIAIFPANVYVAGQRIGPLQMPSVPVRAAMQAAYIVLLLVAGYGVPRLVETQPESLPG